MTNKYIKLTDWNEIFKKIQVRITQRFGVTYVSGISEVILEVLKDIDAYKLNPDYKEDNKSCDNCGSKRKGRCIHIISEDCKHYSEWTSIKPDPIADKAESCDDCTGVCDSSTMYSQSDCIENGRNLFKLKQPKQPDDDKLRMAVSNIQGLTATMKEDFEALSIYVKQVTDNIIKKMGK